MVVQNVAKIFSSTGSLAVKLTAFVAHALSGFWFRIAHSRVIQRSAVLLRTLGLGIITFFRGTEDEPPKVLIDASVWRALARCTIHIVPAVLSISLIALNQIGYFIGQELEGGENQDGPKLGWLQIAAKIQVHSSLTKPGLCCTKAYSVCRNSSLLPALGPSSSTYYGQSSFSVMASRLAFSFRDGRLLRSGTSFVLTAMA